MHSSELRLIVDIFPMPYFEYEDDELSLINIQNHPVIADSQFVSRIANELGDISFRPYPYPLQRADYSLL